MTDLELRERLVKAGAYAVKREELGREPDSIESSHIYKSATVVDAILAELPITLEQLEYLARGDVVVVSKESAEVMLGAGRKWSEIRAALAALPLTPEQLEGLASGDMVVVPKPKRDGFSKECEICGSPANTFKSGLYWRQSLCHHHRDAGQKPVAHQQEEQP